MRTPTPFITLPNLARFRRWLLVPAVSVILVEGLVLCAHAQTLAGDQETVRAHLNAVINWYKKLTTDVPPGQEPSDAIYSTNAQNFGAQVVRLALQSARAQAELISQASATNGSQNTQPSENNAASPQRYAQLESEAAQRVSDDQANIEALKANPRAKGNVADQIQALEGKLELDQATLDAVRSMKRFVEESNSGGTALERNINELARSVPEVFNNGEAGAKPASPATTKAQANSTSGLLGQLMILYREMLSLRSIQQRLSENDDIQKTANDLRAPLRKKMSETLQQGRNLSGQSNVPRAQYDALAQQFKQLSGALLPLSEEVLVLDQSRSNLLNWRSAHTSESRRLLISIVLRVVVILVALGIIFAIAEAWRRLTFRYVHDPRRRRQFLVLRRFLMGFFMCTVIVMGFVSEFSSLATFAGFVTAGIAVGLQTVLLSVAAFFFVIGRYGIRVGDRISISGVTGDVIDVGIVRLYIMELAGPAVDLYPTGRIVVFSNSVLFPATTPLFKQLPGADYTWHEVTLDLAPAGNHKTAQEKIGAAVNSVFEQYRSDIERQSTYLEGRIEVQLKTPVPESKLQ